MVVLAKSTQRIASSHEAARRQADIRSAWSPRERRERARQATAQLGLLWAMIQADPRRPR